MEIPNEWRDILSNKDWGEIAKEMNRVFEPLDDILYVTTEDEEELQPCIVDTIPPEFVKDKKFKDPYKPNWSATEEWQEGLKNTREYATTDTEEDKGEKS